MLKNKTLLLVIALLAFSAANGQKKELTLESLFTDRGFYGASIPGVKWFDNDTKYSFLKSDPETRSTAVYQHDIKTGKESIFLSRKDLVIPGETDNFIIQSYEWSPGERYIIFTGIHSRRRIKYGGTFYTYDVKNKNFSVLAESDEVQINPIFSPDGKKLGFVRSNNLFVADIESGDIKQLTFDGSEVILNGTLDWVYEEEFDLVKGFEWSPDSRTIAFWRLDQSPVPQIKIASWDSLYMNTLDMRYPKAGAKNSLIKIGTVNIESGQTNWIDIGSETDIYIPRMKFTVDPDLISIQRVNRLQNKIELLLADIKTGKSKVILTEESEAWVEVFDDITFLNDGKRFIWTSEKDGYKHIYLYDYSGKQLKQLTKGTWEVDKVHFADKENVIFTANERGIRYTDLYTVNIDDSDISRITDKPGVHSVIVSTGGNYFIDRYSNSTTPTAITLNDISGRKITDIAIPKNDPVKEYGFTPVEFISFSTTDGVELNAAMIKPWNFDENKQYPVIFDIYGGPGSEPTKDKWSGFGFAWQQLMAKEGYIVFMIDNRGTGGRGTAFRHTVYKRLGEMEVNDMIEGAKYLSTLKYVDASRLGITGGSYGGYMAALTLTKAADYFKTGVAISSVTHWKFYDTIYTERFMQTPELNPKGYEESSVMHYAKNYKGNLLIIHGTADDNVHFQNSVELVDALIAANKQFSTMFYPGRNHSIHGQHLYKLVTDYFLNNL
jgi:dipeptidyl-peptidase 4